MLLRDRQSVGVPLVTHLLQEAEEHASTSDRAASASESRSELAFDGRRVEGLERARATSRARRPRRPPGLAEAVRSTAP
jgi:hypothetical protein